MTSVMIFVAGGIGFLRRKGGMFMVTSLALIFLVGLAMAALCRRLGLPRIIGMLLAGILLGPCALDALDPDLLAVSADLRQTPAHVFRDLVLGGDGIAGIETAAAADGGFCDCFVTFHQFSFCHNYFSTVITQSGHIVAQKAQAMHCSGAISSTTK